VDVVEEVRTDARVAGGLALIGLGIALLLAQAGLVDLTGIVRFWPLLLIGVGIAKIRQPVAEGQRALGLAFLLVGALCQTLGILSWNRAWPIFLVALGGFLLWRSANPKTAPRAVEAGPWISDLAFLGGIERRVRVPDFRGGSVTAVLGGIKLDLQESRLGDDPVVLDVAAVLGAVEIRVPADWRVEMRVSSGLGECEDDTRPRPESAGGPRLVLRGHAILGSVSVSN